MIESIFYKEILAWCINSFFNVLCYSFDNPYVQIYNESVKTLITKEKQKSDVVDSCGLKEAVAFERIKLLSFFFCDNGFLGREAECRILKGFPTEAVSGRRMDI